MRTTGTGRPGGPGATSDAVTTRPDRHPRRRDDGVRRDRVRPTRRVPLLVSLALTLVATLAAPVAAAAPDDPYYAPYQWGLRQINAEQAWSTATGAGTTIAIVDSGVDLDHPDLAAKIVGGATFSGCADTGPCGNGDWAGENPHGTHVAGIAAADTNNGRGIAGTAPDANLLAVKVLGPDGGTFAEVAAGIRWAADNGADVINLSLGALPGAQALTITGLEKDVRKAVAYARERGAVVVAAAGNEFASICGAPSFNKKVLCVVATDRREQKATYSNFALDEKPDNVVAAPGGAGPGLGDLSCAEDVISTVPPGEERFCGSPDGEDTAGYDFYAGTSMASPHVAGVAALLREQGLNVKQTVARIKATARMPVTGLRGTYNPVYGHGIVDAAAAVAG